MWPDEADALVQYAKTLLGRGVHEAGGCLEACDELIRTAEALGGQHVSVELVVALLERAVAIADKAGLDEQAVTASAGAAAALVRLDRPRTALGWANDAVSRSEELSPELRAGALYARALAHVAVNNRELAEKDLTAIQDLAPGRHHWMLHGQLAASNQRWGEAREAFRRAVDAAYASGDLSMVSKALWELAQMDRALGDTAGARSDLQRAGESRDAPGGCCCERLCRAGARGARHGGGRRRAGAPAVCPGSRTRAAPPRDELGHGDW